MKKSIVYFLLISAFIQITACKKQVSSTNEPQNENELISTVRLNFIDTATNDTLQFTWQQMGGPGTAIAVDSVSLKPNTSYQGYIEILDETKSPVFVVSDEIKVEANAHLFKYISSTTRLQVSNTDSDFHVPPIELGLQFLARTNSDGNINGTLEVLLRHYTPESPKALSLENGTSDMDVIFPLKVE